MICKVCGIKMRFAEKSQMIIYAKNSVSEKLSNEFNLEYKEDGLAAVWEDYYSCNNLCYQFRCVSDKITVEFFAINLFGNKIDISNSYIRNECILSFGTGSSYKEYKLPYIRYESLDQFLEKIKLYAILQ